MPECNPNIDRTLSWQDVEEAGKLAFNIWTHGRERRWAKQTWEAFVEADLATYSNELQRHVVALRFLALGGLYHDFCALAWDESDEPWYTNWAGSFELQDFVIGQLVGAEPDIEDAGSGLIHVIRKFRPEVVQALIEISGDEEELFASLWRINETFVEAVENDEDDNTPRELTDDEIFNEDWSTNKQAAYEWVKAGCPVVLDPV